MTAAPVTTPLAPCPGCGGDVLFVSSASDIGRHAVQCGCGWSGPWVSTDEEARAQWNRRAPTLRWRSEPPPDVPGWWWIREPGSSPRAWHLSAAEVAEMREVISRRGNPYRHEWAGPIPEPEEGVK